MKFNTIWLLSFRCFLVFRCLSPAFFLFWSLRFVISPFSFLYFICSFIVFFIRICFSSSVIVFYFSASFTLLFFLFVLPSIYFFLSFHFLLHFLYFLLCFILSLLVFFHRLPPLPSFFLSYTHSFLSSFPSQRVKEIKTDTKVKRKVS